MRPTSRWPRLALVLALLGLVPGGEGASARTKYHALVLYAHGGEFFIAEAKALAAALHRRGYATELADTESSLVHPFPEIQQYVRGETTGILRGTFLSAPELLGPHDRLILAIECDGALNPGVYRTAGEQVDPNGFVVTSRGQRVGSHSACSLSSDQIAQFGQIAKARQIELIVIDSSGSGGATTFVLEPMGICAISTAAPGSPAVTGDPPFSRYLDMPFVRTFSDLAIAGGMTILAQFPERPQQSGYYSTASGHAANAMTLRAALIAFEQALGDWNLWTTDVYPYLYRHVAAPATRAKLGFRDPPPAPSSPSLEELLKMADNFDDILQDVLRGVERRWAQEDADLSGPRQDPGSAEARKVALFNSYRGGEFVTSPLLFSTATATAARGALIVRDAKNHVPLLRREQIPATIQDTHQLILRQIRQIQANHRVLMASLSTLEAQVHARGGKPSNPTAGERTTLAAVVRAQTSNQQLVGLLSKLLGIIEDVEYRSDRSPCDATIN